MWYIYSDPSPQTSRRALDVIVMIQSSQCCCGSCKLYAELENFTNQLCKVTTNHTILGVYVKKKMALLSPAIKHLFTPSIWLNHHTLHDTSNNPCKLWQFSAKGDLWMHMLLMKTLKICFSQSQFTFYLNLQCYCTLNCTQKQCLDPCQKEIPLWHWKLWMYWNASVHWL